MTTDERLERLERELVDTRKELAELPFKLGEGVQTRSVEIIGEGGEARCVLDVGEGGPELRLIDEAGLSRITLGAGEHGAELCLTDEDGNTRAILFVGVEGPSVTMFDRKGKVRAEVSVDQTEPPHREPPDASEDWRHDERSEERQLLFDENGEPRAWLHQGDDEPELSLFDEDQQETASEETQTEAEAEDDARFYAGLPDEGCEPVVRLFDKQGKVLASLRLVDDGPRLDLYDKNGRPIWSAP